jgi:5-oxoprolinase (ATP-hydrolysing) subunit C
MSAALEVVAPGFLTTVQDLGRFGYQRFGVSPAGAIDGHLLQIANALVGNAPDEAALEMTLQGATLTITAPAARLAFAGDFAVAIDDQPASPYSSHILRRGQVLAVGRAQGGMRGYLAVAGGLAVAAELGSRATHLRARLGGIDGRELRMGDQLELCTATPPVGIEHALASADIPARRDLLRVVLGPQDDYFDTEEIARFFAASYTVTAASDRMGMRLAGPRIRHARGFDVISDAVVTGSIQVPGSGEPIVMLAERQTTGGYPKLGTVIGADLRHLAQAPPGTTLRFAPVDLAEAQLLRAADLAWLAGLPQRLVPAGTVQGWSSADRLLGLNLISGVADAASDS